MENHQKNGVLLLNKPRGITSNAALGRVKFFFKTKKAGHCGTLDPLASGLLPICLGEATKFSADLLNAPKKYCATIQFGSATDSGDAEGAVILENPAKFSREAVESVLPRFTGEIAQIPPMFSALKFQGQPLYKLARQGLEIARQARHVTIFSLKLINFDEAQQSATLEVFCSKGTYIRALARDLGEALSNAAHLTALTRTAVAEFSLDDSVDLETLQNAESPAIAFLKPIDFLLQSLPSVDLESHFLQKFTCGNAVPFSFFKSGDAFLKENTLCRVYAHNFFLGTAIFKNQMLQPKRLVDLKKCGFPR